MSKIQSFTVCMLGFMHNVLSTSESVIFTDTAALFEFYLEL
jgi:hypothetical protein